jgi:hypothetical protein
MAKKKKRTKQTKYLKLWSPSIVGSIYFDKDGNWWIYEEKSNVASGFSPNVKGVVAKVIPHSFDRDERQLMGVI